MNEVQFYLAIGRASKGKSNAQVRAAWERAYARGFGRLEISEAILLAFQEEIER